MGGYHHELPGKNYTSGQFDLPLLLQPYHRSMCPYVYWCAIGTVFPRIDAAAFIYFVGQFGAATIRGRRLFEGGVYYFRQYDSATYTASSPSNCVNKQVRKSNFRSRDTQNNNSHGQDSASAVRDPRLEH